MFRSMETFGLFCSLCEYMPEVLAKSSSLILLEVCASNLVLLGWRMCGLGRQSPGLLNLTGTDFPLRLDGFVMVP